MSTLEVMDNTGDTKTVWDPDNPAEVAAARATFDTLRGKGFTAYAVNEHGGTGEVIREFDPQAGRIIMRPAMQGG